jgi:hypothetical protein
VAGAALDFHQLPKNTKLQSYKARLQQKSRWSRRQRRQQASSLAVPVKGIKEPAILPPDCSPQLEPEQRRTLNGGVDQYFSEASFHHALLQPVSRYRQFRIPCSESELSGFRWKPLQHREGTRLRCKFIVSGAGHALAQYHRKPLLRRFQGARGRHQHLRERGLPVRSFHQPLHYWDFANSVDWGHGFSTIAHI